MRAWQAFAARQAAAPADQSDWQGQPAGPPTGVAVFAADSTIRGLTDPAGAIQHWSEYDRGGHFAAMETPDLLIEDIRTFCRTLR